MVRCPHCGEWNALGSNICGGCMRDIRQIANPERSDLEKTAKKKMPRRPSGPLQRFLRWWERRRRRAE